MLLSAAKCAARLTLAEWRHCGACVRAGRARVPPSGGAAPVRRDGCAHARRGRMPRAGRRGRAARGGGRAQVRAHGSLGLASGLRVRVVDVLLEVVDGLRCARMVALRQGSGEGPQRPRRRAAPCLCLRSRLTRLRGGTCRVIKPWFPTSSRATCSYLFGQGVVHGDLKPQNCLLCTSGDPLRGFTVKICGECAARERPGLPRCAVHAAPSVRRRLRRATAPSRTSQPVFASSSCALLPPSQGRRKRAPR